jgi:hypothetical protein
LKIYAERTRTLMSIKEPPYIEHCEILDIWNSTELKEILRSMDQSMKHLEKLLRDHDNFQHDSILSKVGYALLIRLPLSSTGFT